MKRQLESRSPFSQEVTHRFDYADTLEIDECIKSLHEGVVMTDHLLLKTFKEFGVVPHGEVGEKFDPNLHDAMFEYHDEEKDCGTIGQVVKTGYLISSRVLRPAQVGTIKKKD